MSDDGKMQLALVSRLAVVFVLVCLFVALTHGMPHTCDSFTGPITGQPIEIRGSCNPTSPVKWWNSGAQLSRENIDHGIANQPASNDPIGYVFHWIDRHFGGIGVDIWNPLARNVVTRWLMIAVASAAAVDLVKAGAKWLIRPLMERNAPTSDHDPKNDHSAE
jgi:hypothetical protein